MSQICRTMNVDHLKTGDIISILKIEVLRPDENGNYPSNRNMVITSGMVTYVSPGNKGKTEFTLKSHDGRTLNYAFLPDSDTVCTKKNGVRTAELYLLKGILTLSY